MNERINAFVSIITLNTIYNVTYSGTIPFDMIHRIGHRKPEGEPDKWIIFKYVYGNPLSI